MSDLDKNIAVKSMVVMRKAFRTIDAKGRMKIGELIDCMLATSGNMTVVIKNMEKKGWLIRKACQTDKRAFEIDLTDEGRRIIQAAIPHISEQLMRLFPFCLLTNSPNW